MPIFPSSEYTLRIPYFEKIGAEPIYLTAQDFYDKFGCVYQEGVTSNFGTPNLADEAFIEVDEDAVKAPSMQSLSSLAILNMGVAGHGLITTTALPANAILGDYAGLLKVKGAIWPPNDYAMSFGSVLFIDAEKSGNLMRFLQHLPYRLTDAYPFFLKHSRMVREAPSKEEGLAKMHQTGVAREFNGLAFHDPSTNALLATTNVNTVKMIIDGMPVWRITTLRAIEAGEVLGYSYWLNHKIAPRYFQKSGALIPESAYERRKPEPRGSSSIPSRFFSGLDSPNAYELGRKAYNEKDYQNVIFHLRTALNSVGAEQDMVKVECYSMIGASYIALQQIEDSIEAYTNAVALAELIRPNKKALIEELQYKIDELKQQCVASKSDAVALML